MPLTPVPLMDSASLSETLDSVSSRMTDGIIGLLVCGACFDAGAFSSDFVSFVSFDSFGGGDDSLAEVGDEDDDAGFSLDFAGGAGDFSSSAGTSTLEMSSPSSASIAIVFPTGTALEPSLTYGDDWYLGCSSLASHSALTHHNLGHYPIVLRFYVHCSLICLLPRKPRFELFYIEISGLHLLTISSSTSPAENLSPSLNFHEASPPSVIVGLMAGIVNFVMACAGEEL